MDRKKNRHKDPINFPCLRFRLRQASLRNEREHKSQTSKRLPEKQAKISFNQPLHSLLQTPSLRLSHPNHKLTPILQNLVIKIFPFLNIPSSAKSSKIISPANQNPTAYHP